MSYSNPQSNEAIRLAVGLDAVLLRLQASFQTLDFIEDNHVFLRAYENHFSDSKGIMHVMPQVYIGNGEYYNALENDNLPCAIFFCADNFEKVIYTKPGSRAIISYERPMSLIFSGDLRRIIIAGASDYIFTELIKERLMEVLAKAPDVLSIDRYTDDPVEDVFKGFSIPDDRKQYGKYPFTSLRINFTVSYKSPVTPC